jgi:putative nucleotidyltransferase with HDIG domain
MKRILFVDDESNILDGIRRMMYSDRARWEMTYAIGGEAALHAFEESGGFDVVVSDMMMPGMNGVELLRTVRERHPDTVRLILSGYSDSLLSAKAASVAHQLINKPCSGDCLRASIERVCTLQDVLSAPELRAVVGGVDKLPTLSQTYQELSRVLQKPDVSIAEVADVIEKDIAMSAKILQLVNNAFFGLAQKITQISLAIELIGVNTIQNLALTSEAFTVFKPDQRFPESFIESLQSHAHQSAFIVTTFGMCSRERDIAIVAALLHDIGRLIMACKMPDCFRTICDTATLQHRRYHEVEEEMLGVSHAEIGAYLLGLWGISDHVVEAIAHHHHPTRVQHERFDSAVAVYLADLLVHDIESHPEDTQAEQLDEVDRAALNTLNLMESYPAIREKAQQGIYQRK